MRTKVQSGWLLLGILLASSSAGGQSAAPPVRHRSCDLLDHPRKQTEDIKPCSQAKRDRPEQWLLATAGQGGMYIRVGKAIAETFSEGKIKACTSGGSAENVELLKGKRYDDGTSAQVELALVQSDVAHEIWKGHGGPTPPAAPAITLVAPLLNEVVHVLVRPHLYVARPTELEGRRVWLGDTGSGSEQTALEVLEALGASDRALQEFRKQNRTLNDEIQQAKEANGDRPTLAVVKGMMLERRIDAVFRTTVRGDDFVSCVLSEEPEAHLIPLNRERFEPLLRGNHSYVETFIRAKTYRPEDPAVPTLAVQTLLLTRLPADSEAIADLAMTLRDQRKAIEDRLNAEQPEKTVQLSLLGVRFNENMRPFVHPKAERYLSVPTEELMHLVSVCLGVLGAALVVAALILGVEFPLVRRLLINNWKAIVVLAVSLLLWLPSAWVMHRWEGDINEDFSTLPRASWQMLLFVGGLLFKPTPMTPNGQKVLEFTQVLGVLLVGGGFVKLLIEFLKSRAIPASWKSSVLRRLSMHSDVRGHIVILNGDHRTDEIISQLYEDKALRGKRISVVCEVPLTFPLKRAYDLVTTVTGDATDKRILQQVRAQHAQSVMILSAPPLRDPSDRSTAADPDAMDNKTIRTILAVRTLCREEQLAETPSITAEILSLKNRESALDAGEGKIEIICREEFAADFLTHCTVTPGLARVYKQLLTFTDGTSEIYTMGLPKECVGKSFGDTLRHFAATPRRGPEAIIPIGVKRASRIFLNPGDDQIGPLQPDDRLFVLSDKRPREAGEGSTASAR